MAYDTKLAERIRTTLEDRRAIKEKEMFGGICFLSDDKMFVGVVKDELMARVGPLNTDRAIKEAHVRRMDFTGRPMAGYIFVGQQGLGGRKLGEYLEMALTFVATVKKSPKRKARKKAAAAVPKTAKGGTAKTLKKSATRARPKAVAKKSAVKRGRR